MLAPRSKIITRKFIFPISLAQGGGLGIVDEMRVFPGIDSWIGAWFD
jgi:hypothetical protein